MINELHKEIWLGGFYSGTIVTLVVTVFIGLLLDYWENRK